MTKSLIDGSTIEFAWQKEYSKKITSDPTQAVKFIQSGDHVYIHSNAAAPQTLIESMTQRAPELKDVTILHILTRQRQIMPSKNMQIHLK